MEAISLLECVTITDRDPSIPMKGIEFKVTASIAETRALEIGQAVSVLFGSSGLWYAAVVSLHNRSRRSSAIRVRFSPGLDVPSVLKARTVDVAVLDQERSRPAQDPTASKELCSYCEQPDSESFQLVKCRNKNCSRWFCNGYFDARGSHQKESHIIAHLRQSGHNQVAVKAISSAGQADAAESELPGLTSFRCSVCRADNIFDLQMRTALDGRNAAMHFCSSCSSIPSTGHNYPSGTGVPFVDCHYGPEDLRCVNEKIVPVPSAAQMSLGRQITYQETAKKEREWSGQAQSEEEIRANLARLTEFPSAQFYANHFAPLVRLESQKEQSDMRDISTLEGVAIIDRDLCIPINQIKFKTNSLAHTKTLRTGQAVSVHFGSSGPWYSAVVSSHKSRGGASVICVRFSPGLEVPAVLQAKTVDVALIPQSQNFSFTRQLKALQRFSGGASCSREILATILGRPVLRSADSSSGFSAILADIPSRPLNTSQQLAVQKALISPVSLIQGPPGTGKTHTIVGLVCNILEQNRDSKVLCCAPSNSAADQLAVLLSRSIDNGVDRVLRIHADTVDFYWLESEELKDLTLFRMLETTESWDHEATELWNVTNIIRSRQVICTTCNTAMSRYLKNWSVETVIIDEAGRATEPDTLIPLIKGCKKLVLAGDEKQLGVRVKAPQLKNSSLGQTLFERLLKLDPEQVPRQLLDTQYRMHPTICAPVSQLVYGGELKCGPDVEGVRSSSLLDSIFPLPKQTAKRQLRMIDTGNLDQVASDGRSKLNGHEAALVGLCVLGLLKKDPNLKPKDIGVITFYHGQKAQIEQDIERHSISCISKSAREELKIDTVDGFQGREKDYIIMSCVRSGPNGKTPHLGFLDDRRRVNVAMSRAKKGIIIVGNSATLERSDVWREFLAYHQPKIDEASAFRALAVVNSKRFKCNYCDKLCSR